MKVSLQAQIALIYTSQGSQRAVARLTGLSHQRVGRILKAGYPEIGGYAANSRALLNPGTIAAVSAAFKTHTKLARSRARADGLPFDSTLPVYYRRAPMHKKERVVWDDGSVSYELQFKPDGSPVIVPGDRIIAEHTHWLPDELRNAWIARLMQTNAYNNVSIRSTIDLYRYNAQAEDRFKAQARNPKQEYHRRHILLRLARNLKIDPYSDKRGRYKFNSELAREIKKAGKDSQGLSTIYTPMIPMDQDPQQAIWNLVQFLKRKHEPATGEPGTKLSDEILLQWNRDNVKSKSTTKPRAAGKPTRRKRRVRSAEQVSAKARFRTKRAG